MNRKEEGGTMLQLLEKPVKKIVHDQEETAMPSGRFLNSICQDRIDELGNKLMARKDYKAISKSCRKINKLLVPTLTEEQKRLIDLLDEEQGRMLALYEDFYYQGGLIDGCSLGRAMSKNIIIKSEVEKV